MAERADDATGSDEAKRWDGPPLEAWDPWRPEQAAAQLSGLGAPWYVVGGWAVDLFLGRETREHEDLEICLPREDFPAIRDHLAAYRLHAMGENEAVALGPDELPPPHKHQNWVHETTANVWRMDVMLEPGDAETWVFRRDAAIRAPRARMIGSRGGIPYLRPEGVLLFKAKLMRDKDERDFENCLAELSSEARRWLGEALARTHPGHAWLERL